MHAPSSNVSILYTPARLGRVKQECVEELIGNPALRDMMAYAPERAYADAKGDNRIYDELWMGDWWWETQVSTHHRLQKMRPSR